MAERETQIGKAKMKQPASKPLTFKLKPESVKLEHLDKSIQEIITSVDNFESIIVDELPTASASTVAHLYLLRQLSEENEETALEESNEEEIYEKYITITDDTNYTWLDLGPTGPMPIEPTSSAEALWNDETVATNGLINEDWMETYHGFVITNLALKQAVLQNQVNIKSINGQSLLGSGNIDLTTITFAVARRLPTASSATLNKIYLIPSENPDKAAHNIKDEYMTLQNEGTPMDAFDNVYFKPTGTPELPSDISVTSAILTQDNVKAKLQVYTGSSLVATLEPDRGTVVYATGENVYYKVIDPSQGQSQTVSDWEKVEEAWVQYFWEKIGSTEIDLSNYYTKAQINAMLDGVTLEIDASNRLVITKDSSRYFAQLTELVKPDAPSITGSTAFNIVINNSIQPATINISKPEGSTAYYRTPSGGSWGEWIAITGTSFTLSSGFANDGTAAEKDVNIQLKSILNGEESNYANSTITFKPKIASVTFGSPSGSEYDKTRTITATPSITAGLGSNTSHYKIGSGSDVDINAATTVTLTASGYNQSMTLYGSVDAKTGWINADGSNSGAIKIGTPKIYWAVMSSLPTTNGEVEAMTNALSQKTFPTVTLPNSGVQGKYLVLAYNYTTVGNKNVTSVKDQNNLSYTFHIETVGDFKLCVVDNLAASAAGLKFTFA